MRSRLTQETFYVDNDSVAEVVETLKQLLHERSSF